VRLTLNEVAVADATLATPIDSAPVILDSFNAVASQISQLW
jgi:hypothetical protein